MFQLWHMDEWKGSFQNTTFNSVPHSFVQTQNICKVLKGEIDPYFWKREVYKESISKLQLGTFL